MNTDNVIAGMSGVCRTCGTRIAQSDVPFYCAKSSEMRAGLVPIYAFKTPVCDECITERTSRRVRRYWLVSAAIAAVVGAVAFALIWADLSKGSSNGLNNLFVALFLASVPGAVVLVFAAIISIQACSKKFVATQLAVKAQKAELDRAGFTGYWMAPPKNLTIRRY
jgi:hypothetical protein